MTEIDDINRRFNTHDWIPEEDRLAVLLIDLQEYFRGIIHPILENIVRLISAAREKKVPLIFTQHSHEPGADHGMLGRWNIHGQRGISSHFLKKPGIWICYSPKL